MLATLVSLVATGCPPLLSLHFDAPLPDQVSLGGAIDVALALPEDADLATVVVRLDGYDVTAELAVGGGQVAGSLDVPGAGQHLLSARVEVAGVARAGAVAFRTVELDDPDACEVLNAGECLLPYPSSRFLRADPATATGLRVDLPQVGLPTLPGPALVPDAYNELDGFSPFAAILMLLAAPPDLELSDASRLLDPLCCGQPAGPPWVDTRSYDARSLEPDSPTLLIDAESGERVLHFVELDARAAALPERQSLILRPAQSLQPGRRYVVAVRNLVDSTGVPIAPEPVYEAVRDGLPTTIPAVFERQAWHAAHVHPVLEAAGVDLASLQLAFDFTVQSDDQLTRQMLSMRDQAFGWLDAREAELVPGDPGSQTFAVTSVQDFACAAADGAIGRRVAGTFQAPLFLTGPLTVSPAQFMNTDENDVPVMNGVHAAPFTIAIPCAALSDEPDAPTAHPLLLGHGLLGDGASFVDGAAEVLALIPGRAYLMAGTDWRGLSAPDVPWLVQTILGPSPGNHRLNDFPAMPDRLRQGMLNTLVLSRMLKRGLFNNDPAFQTAGGAGVFPGEATEQYYYGISLGGIMGTWLAALNPDIERYGLDVPAVNFGMLLQRSTQFTVFEALLANLGLSDPLDALLGLGILQELWVSAEPAGYARHVTADPLPGSGGPKRLLYSVAWLDKQVSNQATEIAARTLGLPNLDASIAQGFAGIPDVAGPADSAMVIWDTGSFDLLDPAHQPFIPPLANQIPSSACDPHGARPRIPAGILQLLDFLSPGGQIANTCDGLCDAGSADERPEGRPPEQLCDPVP